MRVVVNAVAVQPGGGQTYLRELMRHLPAAAPQDEFVVLATPRAEVEGAAANVRLVTQPFRSLPIRTAWEQLRLPLLLRKWNADLLYAQGNQGPVIVPARFVLLVQNVAPLLPLSAGASAGERLKMFLLREIMRRSIRRATRVIAVSAYARNLLWERLGERGSIDVIPHGAPVDGLLPPPALPARLAALPRPFFLVASNVAYHKNFECLFEAMALAAGRRPDLPPLVIAGSVVHHRYHEALIRQLRAAGITGRVHWIGWTSPEVMRALYAEALGLLFPSKVESFGLPPLEAMAYGTPVAASRIPPVEEVCGQAVVYFDPDDAEAIASAIIDLADDARQRNHLSAAGRARAAQFSWEETARRTATVLMSAAKS